MAGLWMQSASADVVIKRANGCGQWHTCPSGYLLTGTAGRINDLVGCGEYGACAVAPQVSPTGVYGSYHYNAGETRCEIDGFIFCAKVCN